MVDKSADVEVRNQPDRAEFISPPNTIKSKVGSGGLPEEILSRAQDVLESHNIDFKPVADLYLKTLLGIIQELKSAEDVGDAEHAFGRLIYPVTQLKSNGSMFRYPIITTMAVKFLRFIEKVEDIDTNAVDIVEAFHNSMYAVVQSEMKGYDGESAGQKFIAALDQACHRYFSTVA